MANIEHLTLLLNGVESWNQWRKENPLIRPDLSRVNLSRKDFKGANFHKAKFSHANLNYTDLSDADLSEANLREARLAEANLRRANASKCTLVGAYLYKANLRQMKAHQANMFKAYLYKVNLSEADLRGANLRATCLIGANLEQATLTNCLVYGISAWNLKLNGAKQSDLIVSYPNEPTITVDNLDVAQFIYLLINNEKIRHVIDTITSKVVLILGRFTSERKIVLDAIREELRNHNYLPILFDFDVPRSRDTDETVNLLARMARFIIADLTDAKSIPQELKGIIETLPSVPIQPILQNTCEEYGMFDHIKRYPWVLKTYYYSNYEEAVFSIREKVILPAEAKVAEVRRY